ncbi:Chaperonin CPN60, mitochondrial [Capsicum chinense]|nr:Chaperonin CPN60, mitochondrial [Capsicum chinense]
MDSTRGDPTGEYGISLREEILQVIEEWKKPRLVPVPDSTESEPFRKRRDGRGPGHFLPIKKKHTYNIIKLVNNIIFGIPEKFKEGYGMLGQDGKTLDNQLEVAEGMKLDRGYNHHTSSQIRRIRNVYRFGLLILVKLAHVHSEALATLILNNLYAGIKVCAIKALGFSENRKANL